MALYMDVKIIKELGKGMFGTTYLVEKNNKKFALKRQKILPKFIKKSNQSALWREIDFYKWVDTLDKSDREFFVYLYDYKIYECSFDYIPVQKPRGVMKKMYTDLKKSKFCVDFLIDLKDNTIVDLLKLKLDDDQKQSVIIQCLYILYLIHKNGYYHCDIHSGNIMYTKCDEATEIKINIDGKKYKFKSGGYQISIIDYGLVLHKKFIKTDREKKLFDNSKHLNIDLYGMIDIFLQYDQIDCIKNKMYMNPLILLQQLYKNYYEDYLKYKAIFLSLWNGEKTINLFKSFENNNNDPLFKKHHAGIPYEIMQTIGIVDKKLLCELMNVPYFPNFIDKQILEVIKFNTFEINKSILFLLSRFS